MPLLPPLQEAAETGLGPAQQQREQQQQQQPKEEDAFGAIERETSRFRVVHHVPRTSLEIRRRSALGEGPGAGSVGGDAGGSGHLHVVLV